MFLNTMPVDHPHFEQIWVHFTISRGIVGILAYFGLWVEKRDEVVGRVDSGSQ